MLRANDGRKGNYRHISRQEPCPPWVDTLLPWTFQVLSAGIERRHGVF